MYRPQFPYPPTPANCQDQRCTYSFDGSNTPLLSGTLAAGGQTGRIPLLLDRDADFLIRGIQVSATTLAVGIEDAAGHQIVFPTSLGLPPTLVSALWAQCDGGPYVALDSDNWGIYCRAGAALKAYVQNPTTGTVAFPVITLHGIKRFKGARCK